MPEYDPEKRVDGTEFAVFVQQNRILRIRNPQKRCFLRPNRIVGAGPKSTAFASGPDISKTTNLSEKRKAHSIRPTKIQFTIEWFAVPRSARPPPETILPFLAKIANRIFAVATWEWFAVSRSPRPTAPRNHFWQKSAIVYALWTNRYWKMLELWIC